MDNTALSQYHRCPSLFEMTMLDHCRGEHISPALNYGSTWHKILEFWYKTGDVSIAEAAGERAYQEHDKVDDYRTLERAIREFKRYREKYGDGDLAQTVGWPDSPQVEIVTEATWPEAAYPYAVKLDRFIQVNGQLLIEDHKTASQDRSDFFTSMEMSNQMMGYAFVAQLLTGRAIAGVRINRHVVRKNDSIHDRQTIFYSQPRLRDWNLQYNRWIERIRQDLEYRAQGHPFPKNFNACSGKYGMCHMIGICSLPLEVQERALAQDYPNRHPWNPLEAEDDAE
jgi:hypothetical protein